MPCWLAGSERGGTDGRFHADTWEVFLGATAPSQTQSSPLLQLPDSLVPLPAAEPLRFPRGIWEPSKQDFVAISSVSSSRPSPRVLQPASLRRAGRTGPRPGPGSAPALHRGPRRSPCSACLVLIFTHTATEALASLDEPRGAGRREAAPSARFQRKGSEFLLHLFCIDLHVLLRERSVFPKNTEKQRIGRPRGALRPR